MHVLLTRNTPLDLADWNSKYSPGLCKAHHFLNSVSNIAPSPYPNLCGCWCKYTNTHLGHSLHNVIRDDRVGNLCLGASNNQETRVRTRGTEVYYRHLLLKTRAVLWNTHHLKLRPQRPSLEGSPKTGPGYIETLIARCCCSTENIWPPGSTGQSDVAMHTYISNL